MCDAARRAEAGADVKGLPKPKGLGQLLCDGKPLEHVPTSDLVPPTFFTDLQLLLCGERTEERQGKQSGDTRRQLQ